MALIHKWGVVRGYVCMHNSHIAYQSVSLVSWCVQEISNHCTIFVIEAGVDLSFLPAISKA